MRRMGSLLPVVLLPAVLACTGQVQVSDLKERDGIWYVSDPSDPFTGEAVAWHDNGQPMTRKPFVDGKVDGVWTEWNEDGGKRYEASWKEGKQHGPSTWWYDDGQMKKQEEYAMDVPNGVHREWYENGQMKSQRPFIDGDPDGTWLFWTDQGRVDRKEVYKDGVLERAESREDQEAAEEVEEEQ